MSRSASLDRPPTVAVVITTRNRRDELRRALTSVCAQDYGPLEVRVYDDASDDDTAEMVRHEFPGVTVARSATRVGYIPLRNLGYSQTQAKYLVSIDDDAWLTDRSTVSVLVDQLERNDRLAGLAIPYFEANTTGVHQDHGATVAGAELRSFVGTSHVCRVAAVRAVGGYREFLVHQGEERDLCLRLRTAGWSIKVAGAPPVVHGVSPNRDKVRMHRFAVRNQVLFDFLYAPVVLLPGVLARHAWQLLRYRQDPRWAMLTCRYLADGLLDCWRFREHRAPLSVSHYRSHMSLPAHGARFVSADELPSPCLPLEAHGT